MLSNFRYYGGEEVKVGDYICLYIDSIENLPFKKILVDVDENGYVKYKHQYTYERYAKCNLCKRLIPVVIMGSPTNKYILIAREE